METKALTLLIVFSAVSILGFSSIAHTDHAAHHSCLFDISDNCASLANPINSVVEHLSGLQDALQAVSITNIFSILLLVVFSLLATLFIFQKFKLKAHQYFREKEIQFHRNLFEIKNRFLGWLSILNKRDPLVLRAVR